MEGKKNLAERLRGGSPQEPAVVTIQHVVTHGKAGAVNGTLKFNAGQLRDFYHVFEFTNSKGASVQANTSYVIQIK